MFAKRKVAVEERRQAILVAESSKLLASLGDLLGMVLLNLGPPRLLLGLELQPAHLLVGTADTLAGSHQSAVSIPLGHLGTHDMLSGLDDAGVHLGVVALPEPPVE